jgi:ribosomal protein L11 methyltransferase
VLALFAEGTDLAAVFTALACALEVREMPRWSAHRVDEQDWVRLTQAQFGPIRISDRLWIVPSWCRPVDEAAINIVLDPGLAFGTGSHPTTRLCLEWLDAGLRSGASVLDYGCGSGLLAIAAELLGASLVHGVDIDSQAVTSATANAEANRVSSRFFLPSALPNGEFDLVVANILTNPLCALAPLLCRRVKPGGTLLLSGILAEQTEQVSQAYAPWIPLECRGQSEGWVALAGTKPLS